ncbi:MAG TPA: polysaccharide biosynthesis/export family protein [Bryobacteraceae bacterium]|jgi:polysaccharide export outer membrane protein|nr:polysaccharide biosynthesis/export family protein [Bryobacteraceae bacterium]
MKVVAALATLPLLCSAQTAPPSSSSSESQAPAASDHATVPPDSPRPATEPIEKAAKTSEASETQSATPSPDASLAPPPVRKAGSGTNKESAAAGKSSSNAYIIGPLDVLYIKVWNNPNLTNMVDVQEDGMISMALIGQVKADGLTVEQLRDTLATKLSDYIQTPEVTVQVTKNNSKTYYIMGQGAGRQGAFPLARKTTVSEALTNAGGFGPFANLKKIYVLKKKENYEKKHMFNFKDVLAGKHLEEDIEVQDGDRIIVPE